MINTVLKKPSECLPNDLDSFETLVKEGGEVQTAGLRNRIRKAKWLIFLVEANTILVGIAALKKPKKTYKNGIFKKAKSSVNPDEFMYEAGWVFVKTEFRGRRYSQLLLETVLKLADNVRGLPQTGYL